MAAADYQGDVADLEIYVDGSKPGWEEGREECARVAAAFEWPFGRKEV